MLGCTYAMSLTSRLKVDSEGLLFWTNSADRDFFGNGFWFNEDKTKSLIHNQLSDL